MYAFLLVLGTVATAAGFALIASGVPISEFALGNTLIIAGAVSVIGGLIIIGLSAAIRQLQRIERALAARPMPRTARPGEAAAPAPAVVVAAPVPPAVQAPPPSPVPVAVPENAPVAARPPFPARPKADTRQVAEMNGSAAPSPAAVEETAFERLRQKFPSLTRIDSAPEVEANEVSLSPKTPARPEEYAADPRSAPVPGYTNGATPPPAVSRPEAPPRPPRTAMFDALWPKDGRGRQAAQAAAEHNGMDASTAVAPQAAELPPRAEAHMVSILKSGVVDGMAYTLYSDGSIEAQLPQGTMRFGSITELRNHLERTG